MEKKRQLFLFVSIMLFFLLSFSTYAQNIEPSVIRVWSTLEQGKNNMFVTNVEIAFTQLHFTIKEKVEDVTFNVQKKNSVPNSYNLSGILYQYVLVGKSGLENSDIYNIGIMFRVTKKWADENNINKTSVSLFRYNNAWNKQESEFYLEDDTFYYYNSSVNGFSYFAIVGFEKQTIETEEPVEKEENQIEPVIGTEKQGFNSKLIFIIVLGVITVSGILFINFRNKLIFSAKNTEDLINYIKLAKSQGEENTEIKTKLVNEGWDEKEVDKYLDKIELPEKIKEKLKQYVDKSLSKGKNKEDIIREMLNTGWQKDVIDDLLKNFS